MMMELWMEKWRLHGRGLMLRQCLGKQIGEGLGRCSTIGFIEQGASNGREPDLFPSTR